MRPIEEQLEHSQCSNSFPPSELRNPGTSLRSSTAWSRKKLWAYLTFLVQFFRVYTQINADTFFLQKGRKKISKSRLLCATINTHREETQRMVAANRDGLSQHITIQRQIVADCCTVRHSRSFRWFRELLGTLFISLYSFDVFLPSVLDSPIYFPSWQSLVFTTTSLTCHLYIKFEFILCSWVGNYSIYVNSIVIQIKSYEMAVVVKDCQVTITVNLVHNFYVTP